MGRKAISKWYSQNIRDSAAHIPLHTINKMIALSNIRGLNESQVYASNETQSPAHSENEIEYAGEIMEPTIVNSDNKQRTGNEICYGSVYRMRATVEVLFNESFQL